jgi:ectoine hydroxylase-related dioxygenase (phytanoyl-CoA dioxygenase family)
MTATAAGQPALSREQRQHYDEEGYIILRGVFTAEEIREARDEAERLRQERAELISLHNLRCRFMPHQETGESLFETFDPAIDIAPVCARFAADRRILDVLRAIYDDEPCLFKDKLIYKLPGARGYGLHQDHPNWPGFPKSFVTVVIAYDLFDRHNGATEVFPRYHRQGSLSSDTQSYRELSFDLIDEKSGVPLELQPGDVAIFGCYVPHRSGPNRTDVCRRGLFLSYNAAAEGGPQRDKHYREFHERLRAAHAAQGRADVYFQ